MKKWNSIAIMLVIMVVLQIVLGRTIETLSVEWRLSTSWTHSDTTHLLMVFRVVPIVAIHIGFAVWLHAKATEDNRRSTNLWMLFGLCFSLLAGILYMTIEIFRRLEPISEYGKDKVAATSSGS